MPSNGSCRLKSIRGRRTFAGCRPAACLRLRADLVASGEPDTCQNEQSADDLGRSHIVAKQRGSDRDPDERIEVREDRGFAGLHVAQTMRPEHERQCGGGGSEIEETEEIANRRACHTDHTDFDLTRRQQKDQSPNSHASDEVKGRSARKCPAAKDEVRGKSECAQQDEAVAHDGDVELAVAAEQNHSRDADNRQPEAKQPAPSEVFTDHQACAKHREHRNPAVNERAVRSAGVLESEILAEVDKEDAAKAHDGGLRFRIGRRRARASTGRRISRAIANRLAARVSGGICVSRGLVTTNVVPQITFAATKATIAVNRVEITGNAHGRPDHFELSASLSDNVLFEALTSMMVPQIEPGIVSRLLGSEGSHTKNV